MSIVFTSRQRQAIEAPLGPVLVIAGPGAGKTACLIGRIGFLVKRELVKAERILAVTFTNKAAEEVAARLHEELGPKVDETHRGTIHSRCAEILRDHAAAAGLRPGFGIADDDYQRTVLRQMKQGRRAAQLLQLFTRRRTQGYRLTAGDEQLFGEYLRRLRERNLVDFDDLLVRTAELFDHSPDIAARVAGRWDYVLVDEFQDVNAVQYRVLRALAPHRNIFAVGDDEQSIFSWAGANPEVLARFQRDYGVAQPVLLDRNHRCSRQIFEVARRLLDANPTLFTKELLATRFAPFDVRAVALADDEAETAWILADIAADRDAHGTGWGDYAVLYRRHDAGDRLEARFVKAGVPCRLAKGRPLSEDPVIGSVIAALRLVRDPRDPAAAESFARRVLPEHLLERVQAEIGGGEDDFLRAVRDVAGGMRGDPDAKKLWRLVYQAENLASAGGRHATLHGLVEELLSQQLTTYRNKLEEKHEELSDPAGLPAAAALAARLSAARADRSRLVLEPMNGLEIPLRAMLFAARLPLVRNAAEVEQAELDDVRLGPEDAGPEGLAFTLFKALQLLHARELAPSARDYVAFDLETTGLDVDRCDIVDIAGVRVRDGVVVEEFHSLVKPGRPMDAGARRATGYRDEDFAGAPQFAEVWPRFRAFVGASTLVAHNAQQFDVPVLRRQAAAAGGSADDLTVFDTLPLARSLSGDSAKLELLAQRFGLDAGRAHHALDDARTLAAVYQRLEALRVVRARKSALVNLLAPLGLALVLDGRRRDTDEVALLLDLSRIHALGRFSDVLDVYVAERERLGARGPSLEEVIERLGGRKLMDRLQEEVDPARKYPAEVARLETLIEQAPGEPLADAITRFLERVALSVSTGAEADPHRVNLLTLHSTKRLEFSRVYVVGVEDEQMPGWIRDEDDRDAAIQEARRLLYVGMTRAADRLVLTRVDRRQGKPGGGSRFLEEMGLAVERVGG